jgi:uncharacterized protein (DUF697 family)/GTP-binding protein EngB required for normal cell division
MLRYRPVIVLVWIACLAGAGYGIIRLLPRLAAEYREAADFHPLWGYAYLVVTILCAASIIALIAGTLWWLAANTRRKRARRAASGRSPTEMSQAEREAEILTNVKDIRTLVEDPSLPAEMRAPLREGLEELAAKQAAQKLEIVACGTISSGKSSLLNALAGREIFRSDVQGGTTLQRNEVPWPGQDRVVLVDAPGLAEVGGEERETAARLAARDADLVLFVLDGPIRDFEYRLLDQLAGLQKRIIVCLNKEDWFRPADRELLREQIAQAVSSLVLEENVIFIRSKPGARLRVRVLPDGTQVEERVEEPPDLGSLPQRLLSIVARDGRDLLLANLLLRSRGLATAARAQAQSALDRQAQQIVDRTMWQSAAAAALSPLPLVDLAASLALSTKMVVELGKVYQQPMDLDAASRLIGQLGKHLLSVLGTSLAAPALGTAVATMLKTVPGVGTLAGGVLQGLVQALVTRWIGQVFIVYFRGEMQEPPQGWAGLAREQWAALTRPAELAQFVRAGLKRLGGKHS